jgi:hypothetical protein
MSSKTEIVVCSASYCKVFSTIFLVSEFFNSHRRLHSKLRPQSIGSKAIARAADWDTTPTLTPFKLDLGAMYNGPSKVKRRFRFIQPTFSSFRRTL